MSYSEDIEHRVEIAIIGMAGRFPGASSVEEFWQNLCNGVESISEFTADDLMASGLNPNLLKKPKYVNAGGALDGADLFDAKFFGISAKEAELMDPQHRLFLECAWEALEAAGYDNERYDGMIGVFGGVARNTYLLNNMKHYQKLLDSGALYELLLGSDKDFPATRVSYKLNLRGPSINVQTACSSSGVAIHLACQSLLSGESDMAIAGGARIRVPLRGGYFHYEGGILSPDGHCRAFDHEARGTIYGSGVALIVLKRLGDAINDRDHIHAVIKASAVNNDGSDKVGFTAPSVNGQAAVIEEALAVAEVGADTISYVEAHGTGTVIGDPIEIAALTKAFRKSTDRNGYCAIGSAKTNIGHLDAGACAAGIIKTALALENKLIPPSLNFTEPNPQINFESSPFFVNTELRDWAANETPRRAGVSSFGLGGTNVHLVLEEAPKQQELSSGKKWQILLLSAKTATALTQSTVNLSNFMKRHQNVSLPDVAYTLQMGRNAFEHRRFLVSKDIEDATTALNDSNSRRIVTSSMKPAPRQVVFLFPGQASQYPKMGEGLYRNEPVFRRIVDYCAEFLKPKLSLDLRDVLFANDSTEQEAYELLEQTYITQPAVFIISYAMSRLWMEWGVRPDVVVGHSIGEFAAASVAGILSLEDGLSLSADRGRMLQDLPRGSMLAVRLSEEKVMSYLDDKVSLAAVNGDSLCVLSGRDEDIDRLEKDFSANKVPCGRLRTSHAFHSSMMDPIMEKFLERMRKVDLHAPRIPYLSGMTGTWAVSNDIQNPTYWVKHLRQAVRFCDCAQELLKENDRLFLEVGAGNTLITLLRQYRTAKGFPMLSSIRHSKEKKIDEEFILGTLGQLWLAGAELDWAAFYTNEKLNRIPLPTYPFEGHRYWIGETDRSKSGSQSRRLAAQLAKRPNGTRAVDEYPGAPRNTVEHSLVDIWRDILGVENAKISDNFFDLGGTSLMAVRLNTEIEKIFGKALDPSMIYQAPTIEQLGEILGDDMPQAHADERRSLVLLRDGVGGPPFYCIPGAISNVHTTLGPIARQFDRPVYGLQDGLKVPTKVKEMAAQYIKEILNVQPEGPYLLGGVCSGARIAFEMAHQLHRQQQQIAFLALIEPAPPYPTFRDALRFILERFVHRTAGHSRTLSEYNWQQRKAFILLRLKLIASVWHAARYNPQIYSGPMHIYLTDESFQSPRYAWHKLGGPGTEFHKIPGNHNTITGYNGTPIEEDHMEDLSMKLISCIEGVCRSDHES